MNGRRVEHRIHVGRVVISPELVKVGRVCPDRGMGITVIEIAEIPVYDHRPPSFLQACLYEEERVSLAELLKVIGQPAQVDVVNREEIYRYFNLYPYTGDGRKPAALLSALLIDDFSFEPQPILDKAFFQFCDRSLCVKNGWEMIALTAPSRAMIFHSPNGNDRRKWFLLGSRVSRVDRRKLVGFGFEEFLELKEG